MNYNAWANFSMSLYQVTLFYVSFTQLQQWTEFTMNDVEHCLMWTLWNYIIVNFTWILNDIWMDVKWFEWNFNKQFKEWNISSVIILLPSNPAQRLLWHSVEFNQCPDALWQILAPNKGPGVIKLNYVKTVKMLKMLKMFKKLKMFKIIKMYTSTCSALSGTSQGSQGSGLFQTAQGGPGGLPRAQQPSPASPGPCGHAQPSPALPSHA